jgi:transposase InsO family protein
MAKGSPKDTHQRWAHFRFSVIGPLLAAPPPDGELWNRIESLARQVWQHPISGAPHTVGASTIERWYYQARNTADPVAGLRRRVRSDAGRRKAMGEAQRLALQQQYKDHPNWSYQLHADNLAALAEKDPARYGAPVCATTVRRVMQERGWFRKKKRRNPTPGQLRAEERLENFEVRSFDATHVHAIWHYDFHDCPRRIVDAQGRWITPVLLGILDDCSRVCCHAQWYLAETADNLDHGLIQAFCKRGLPRSTLHDRGGAMMAGETQNGLRDLGILSRPTLPYSPYQNGKQERFWSDVDGRLMAMLENVDPLTLDFLNQSTQAWVEMEYHRSRHDELGISPIERLLQGPSVARSAPDLETMRRAFTVQETRTQRRTDGTLSIGAVRFEVPSHLRTLRRVCVRFRSWDLSVAWIVDERTGDVLARILPLDRARNADGRRRPLEPLFDEQNPSKPSSADPVPPLLRHLLQEYAATGLPPALLPKDEDPHA